MHKTWNKLRFIIHIICVLSLVILYVNPRYWNQADMFFESGNWIYNYVSKKLWKKAAYTMHAICIFSRLLKKTYNNIKWTFDFFIFQHQ